MRAGVPGNYYVNTFRNNNGDKGGFRYDFTIDANQPRLHNFNSPNEMNTDQMRENIRRDILIEMALKRIEEKQDAILNYIVAKESDDSADNDPALDYIKNLAKQGLTQGKNGAVAATNGFAALLK